MITARLSEVGQNRGLFDEPSRKKIPKGLEATLRKLGIERVLVEGDDSPPSPEASKEELFRNYRDALENQDHEGADELHAQLKVAHLGEGEDDQEVQIGRAAAESREPRNLRWRRGDLW